MDEEYYSGAGEWEGTDGNLVRCDLLLLGWLLGSISFAAASSIDCLLVVTTPHYRPSKTAVISSVSKQLDAIVPIVRMSWTLSCQACWLKQPRTANNIAESTLTLQLVGLCLIWSYTVTVAQPHVWYVSMFSFSVNPNTVLSKLQTTSVTHTMVNVFAKMIKIQEESGEMHSLDKTGRGKPT